MASYDYAMVFLKEYNPTSFLLWDHRRDGGSLRDFSKLQNGQPTLYPGPPRGEVLLATEFMVTRFPVEPYRVTGEDGLSHWVRKTEEFNIAELGDTGACLNCDEQ